MISHHVTSETVADRLEQAAHTMKRLPKVRVQGYGSGWPDIVRDGREAYGYSKATVRLGPPSSKYISEMEEALRWLLWLERDEAKIVWLRANGVRWRRIAPAMGFSVRKAQGIWSFAILRITSTLNKDPLSTCFPYKKLLSLVL